MDVVFRTNNDGRIYGVTFIDHENRVALNGSRLGKDYSANVFHSWFNEGIKPKQKVYEEKTVPVQPQRHTHQNNETESGKNPDTSVIEEVFGIFNVKPHGEDYDEIAFARRMRKKKRRI